MVSIAFMNCPISLDIECTSLDTANPLRMAWYAVPARAIAVAGSIYHRQYIFVVRYLYVPPVAFLVDLLPQFAAPTLRHLAIAPLAYADGKTL